MTKGRAFFCIGFALLLVALTSPFGYGQTVRWDIVSVPGANPNGVAFARSNDGSTIRLTGSGTFVVSPEPGVTLSTVTGGGTWQTFPSTAASAATVPAASGTFIVTGLVQWERAPDIGPAPATNPSGTGSPTEEASGLAVLRVAYSDGSRGVITVSCMRGGASFTIFEGVTATKGFVTFLNALPPMPGVPIIDANRTLFHVSP